MSNKLNKKQEKQLPLYAKIIAGAIVGVLVLATVFGTVAMILM